MAEYARFLGQLKEDITMPASTTASTKTRRKVKKAPPKTVKVSPEQRREMIEEAAYFRAERRNFQGGDPVADWLSSEKEVDGLLSQRTH